MKNHQIGIVGGSGFIGFSLAKHLSSIFDVKILDIKAPKSKSNLVFELCDIRDYKQVMKALVDVDLVIHTAIVQIPRINEDRRLGYEVGSVEKRWFVIDGRRVQVDLYGEGTFSGRRVVIVGECSSVIYKRDVKRVWKVARGVSKLLGGVETVPVVFGFIVHPPGREEAKKLNVIVETAYKP